MSDPILGTENTAQGRMAYEPNSAEIEDIKNFPESTAFRFNGLYVRIVGGTDFPEVVAKGLRIEGSVSVEAPLWVDNEC